MKLSKYKTLIVCDNCKKEFYKWNKEIKRAKNHFCYRICKNSYYRTEIQCSYCKKIFSKLKKRIKKQNFCSIKCMSNGYRKHKEWSLNNFNDGYVDACGRFRVYLPNHPRASSNGYILRSIVAYELYKNDIVKIDYNIHHKDKNRLNDNEENLVKILHNEHSSLHNKERNKKVEI